MIDNQPFKLWRSEIAASFVVVFFVLFSVARIVAQSTENGGLESPNSQGTNQDCSDPSIAGSSQCQASAGPRYNGQQAQENPIKPPVLTNPAGLNPDQYNSSAPPLNPSQLHLVTSVRPETEFEQMVADSVGRPLPLFGQSLFVQAPSTFAPVDWTQVPSDYIIGPGDELQINIWGQVQASLRTVVDRGGQIYVPQVGEVSVAGVHYGNLEEHLKHEISKMFKNFNVTANLGRLRSIQVMVVGEARYPGTYTISSLSTLVNAVFASGGPSAQGSLRHIQVRRDGATITDFDFYDLLIKGDKSKDVRLQPGDVLYIPPVGPLVAISGSVNVQAIYEIKDKSSFQELIDIAGGMGTVADTSKITVDRLVDHQARKTLEFPYDEQSQAMPLQDGDIVRVFSIVPRFEDVVTLRGNVANPGRYPWKAGMRVSDLIPNVQALLTRRYWRNRAEIINGSATEYTLRSHSLQSEHASPSRQQSTDSPAGGKTAAQSSNSSSQGALPPDSTNAQADALAAQSGQTFPANGTAQTGDRTAEGSSQTANYNSRPSAVKNVAEDLRSYAPEINWDYAIIQRVNPDDLSSKLVWISPRKILIDRDEKSNLELQSGDIVTIFSQQDVSVPQTERSQYVIVEGEVKRPGVYKLEANETLRSILQRAGGLTPDAYVYGSQLTRESARVDQQRSLDELARTMEVQIRQTAVSVAASSQSGDMGQMLAAQEAIIQQLRSTRASGRVSLPLQPVDKEISNFPNMVLEDGDRLDVPHTPSTVSVVGDVYNPGSFIFQPRNSAGEYLEMAGKGKPQSDLRHAFVLRANGVVVAASNVNGLFTGAKFDRIHLYPGDQVIVPYKLPTGAFIRGLRDWTQISSQLALTAAALAVVH